MPWTVDCAYMDQRYDMLPYGITLRCNPSLLYVGVFVGGTYSVLYVVLGWNLKCLNHVFFRITKSLIIEYDTKLFQSARNDLMNLLLQ